MPHEYAESQRPATVKSSRFALFIASDELVDIVDAVRSERQLPVVVASYARKSYLTMAPDEELAIKLPIDRLTFVTGDRPLGGITRDNFDMGTYRGGWVSLRAPMLDDGILYQTELVYRSARYDRAKPVFEAVRRSMRKICTKGAYWLDERTGDTGYRPELWYTPGARHLSHVGVQWRIEGSPFTNFCADPVL